MSGMLLSKKVSPESPLICPGKKGSSPATSGRKMLSLASGNSFAYDLRTRKSLQPALFKIFIQSVKFHNAAGSLMQHAKESHGFPDS